MAASRPTEPTGPTTLTVEWATSTRQANLTATSAIKRSHVLGHASTRSPLLAALPTVSISSSTETVRRATIP
jgi:hypothetical protein